MPPETSVVARVWKGRFSPTVMRASSLSVVRICGVERIWKLSSVLTALMMAEMLERVSPPKVKGWVSTPTRQARRPSALAGLRIPPPG